MVAAISYKKAAKGGGRVMGDRQMVIQGTLGYCTGRCLDRPVVC